MSNINRQHRHRRRRRGQGILTQDIRGQHVSPQGDRQIPFDVQAGTQSHSNASSLNGDYDNHTFNQSIVLDSGIRDNMPYVSRSTPTIQRFSPGRHDFCEVKDEALVSDAFPISTSGPVSLSMNVLNIMDNDCLSSRSDGSSYIGSRKGCAAFWLLPDDVLFLIFEYLQPEDLCRLSCVNKRFNLLASKDSVWLHHIKRVAIVGSNALNECSAKELFRIAPNWLYGRYKDGFATRNRNRLIPWLFKDGQSILFSNANVIRSFQVRPSGLQENKKKTFHGMEEDATRFVVKNNTVVSGCRNGSIYGWDMSGQQLFCCHQVHKSDAQCVDFNDSVIISGSRDGTCKVLPLVNVKKEKDTDMLVSRSFDGGERVWSLQISPCQSFFAAGLAAWCTEGQVGMWDIESGECRGQLRTNQMRGAGVLDVKFESPHELLACGYDTFLRLWDLRTMTCVAKWEEPFDSVLYCFTTDGENSVAVGTARHGMVRLWDKRKTDPVQVYYSTNCSSPVYSIAMDYGHLYLALDKGLNIMDFSTRNAESRFWCHGESSFVSGARPQH